MAYDTYSKDMTEDVLNVKAGQKTTLKIKIYNQKYVRIFNKRIHYLKEVKKFLDGHHEHDIEIY